MKSNCVDIHADDFGYSKNTSKDILDCMKQGCLDSISIICNTSSFEESMKMLYEAIPSLPFLPLMSVHINIPEGESIYSVFPMPWVKLFVSSYIDKNTIKNNLKKEIKRQIDKTNEVIGKCISIAKKHQVECKQKGIRIDTHVHTHPLPIVWNSLIEVIKEEKYDIEYIRNPKEPIVPFIKHPKLYTTYGLANIIKNRILMFYSRKIDRYCDDNDIKKIYMWGLIMSGYMDFDRIEEIYQDMLKYTIDHNRKLEILFHPGFALEEEYSSELNKDSFNKFNSSINRKIEKQTVLRIKEITG